MSSLPPGFVLDQPVGDLPPGFELDPPAEEQDSFLDDALDVAGEFAAGANRTMMWIPDTLTKAANLIPGVDIPTPSEGIEALTGHKPGQGGYMDPGMAREAVAAGGEVLGPGAMALTPVQGRNLASTPQALAEFLGFGSKAGPVPAEVAQATADAVQRGKGVSPKNLPAPLAETYRPGPVKQQPTELALKRNNRDVARAGYRLDGEEVVKDKAQQQALKVLTEDIVSQVAATNPQTKSVIGQMLDILEQGRRDKTYKDFNPPRLALGDSLFSRYDAVKNANRAAGKAVKAETDALKGVALDLDSLNQGPLRGFAESLNELGVKVNRNGDVFFQGSAFEGLDGPQSIVNRVIKQLNNTQATSAYDVHRMKQWIDEAVIDYDRVKPSGGVKGKADRLVEQLRADINQYLRDLSPGYEKANKDYSDTIQALDNVHKMIGRQNATSPRSMARSARSALSNAQKSENTIKMIDEMEELSARFGAQHDDDLKTLSSFVQTLEKLFPDTKPPAAIGGEITKAIPEVAINAATGSGADGTINLLRRGANKVMGKTEASQQEELLRVLRELISGAN